MKNVPNHQPELVWKVPDLFELPKCIQRQPPHFGDRQRENNMVLPRPRSALVAGCKFQALALLKSGLVKRKLAMCKV